MIEKTDIAIIGAGPCGLFAVFACGMLDMRAHVIDALPDIGGQCTALYPEKPIYDIPGFPQIDAAELIANLEEQAAPFNPVYHLDQAVTGLQKQDDGWILTTAKNTKIFAKAVIIAGGAGAFGPNRPPLENIEAYEGQSVFYMVRRRQDFAGKKIVIAGGGDSAVDWALSLAEIAGHVTLVHRRDKFRAAPESLSRLHRLAESGQVTLAVPYQLKSLSGQDGKLEAVQIIDLDAQEKEIDADILLPFFGLAADLGPIKDWGLGLDHQRIIVDPTSCETNIPSIFAIGDIAAYKNKLKLILSGFHEAEMAAHCAYNIIYPGKALHFEYSTTRGVPEAGSLKSEA